jgi:cytochrome c oxidase subunit 2
MRMRALAMVALLPGCESHLSALSPAGPAARLLADLGWPILIGFLAVSAVMWALTLWAAVRRTGSLASHAPVDAKGGQRWIYLGGFAVPALAFSAIFFATLRTMSAFPVDHHAGHHGAAEEQKGGHRQADIRVLGHQWWWEVQYVGRGLQEFFITANEIHIPAGEPVDVELVSADVIHSLWAPRLHGKVDLVPGMNNFIRLQADRPGVYPGGCAEFCGLQHANMRFNVVADEPARYEGWLREQRAPAQEPKDALAQRGKKLFMSGPCVVCHTVRGTAARGSVGPDLTHLAGRSMIAASLPQDIANLHAWVINAPSLKPGTRMPALTQYSGDELHALVAYLQSLR